MNEQKPRITQDIIKLYDEYTHLTRDRRGFMDKLAKLTGSAAAAAAIVPLVSANGKVGAVGFCWGGGMVNQLAVASPDLAAGVVYYGSSPAAEQVSEIEARMLLHYAALDKRINAGVPAYEEALTAAGGDYTLHMYEGVNHAFNNDTSAARYDEEAANLSFERTIAFFHGTPG